MVYLLQNLVWCLVCFVREGEMTVLFPSRAIPTSSITTAFESCEIPLTVPASARPESTARVTESGGIRVAVWVKEWVIGDFPVKLSRTPFLLTAVIVTLTDTVTFEAV